MRPIILYDLSDTMLVELAIHAVFNPPAERRQRPCTITRCYAPEDARRSCGRFSFPHKSGNMCADTLPCPHDTDHERDLGQGRQRKLYRRPSRFPSPPESERYSYVQVSRAVRRWLTNAIAQEATRDDIVGSAARLCLASGTDDEHAAYAALAAQRPNTWTPRWWGKLDPKSRKALAHTLPNEWAIDAQRRLAKRLKRRAMRDFPPDAVKERAMRDEMGEDSKRGVRANKAIVAFERELAGAPPKEDTT